ncbi:MAG: decaprenylphospho-beta-D-ribofuranose 2-oxidase [Actinomycetota bacterium]|nr:decaprenylphospho-beta-D-ribofuranose 2-oxidase [Actinomycetota bacterium]
MSASMGESKVLTGWGRTAPSVAEVVRPGAKDAIARAFRTAGPRGVLARGLGRSYGDVAQNAGGTILDMTAMAGAVELDAASGTLTVMAGESFDRILRATVPQGWFLPVTPGTRSVTVGGAIANDIHGKNHHHAGSIGNHLVSFELVLPTGGVVTVSSQDDPELFDATLGGMGLTGVITLATLRMLPIATSRIRQDTDRCADLDALMGLMDAEDDDYRYSVAWIDCLARGAALGRGVLTRGDHAEVEDLPHAHRLDPLRYAPSARTGVPALMPGVMTPTAARVFNELWFRRAPSRERGRPVPIAPFFHPLDAVRDWNRLYGRRGFLQYQFVVPFGEDAVVRSVVETLSTTGCPSFLAVLKRFGPGRGMLSFPLPGWTLALDIPVGARDLSAMLDGLDRKVIDAGGRVYLAKDSRLDPASLRTMYPELSRWQEVRERVDPQRRLRSDLDRRLDLDSRSMQREVVM